MTNLPPSPAPSAPPGSSSATPSGMHPQDKRNLLIFGACALVIWLLFEHFVMGPRAEAARQAREQAALHAPTATIQSTALNQAAANQAAPKPLTRTESLKTAERIAISSPEISGSLSLVGARIDDITLKNYYVDLKNTEPVILMSPSGVKGAHYVESGWLSNDPQIKLPNDQSVWSASTGSTAAKPPASALSPDTPVTLYWDNGAGLRFERTYKIDRHFMFELTQRVINNSGRDVTLFPYMALARSGIPEGFSNSVAYEGPVGYIGDEKHSISYDDLIENPAQSFSALNGWIGFGEKYWFSAIIPAQIKNHTYQFQAGGNKSDHTQTLFQLDARGDALTIPNGGSVEDQSHIFIGAKKLDLLNDYNDQLGLKYFDRAIDFGVLYFLTKPLYTVLIFLNGLVGNFGVAIILLTIIVRGLVFPLANKSYRSFAALRKVSPKMAEIKARYGNDKPRLQQELIKLYETEKVNPMAGCFPLLLQIPIFFAVYKVISIAVEMRHAPFFGWIHDLSAHDPLSVFNLFGLLPYNVPNFMMIGPWSILMLAMLLIQKHLNPPPQDQIQRDIANYMPWIMTYMLSHFASGLVIYWAFSNVLSVVQQSFIMRSMGVPIYLFSPDAAREHHEEHQKQTKKVLDQIREEQEKTIDQVSDEPLNTNSKGSKPKNGKKS